MTLALSCSKGNREKMIEHTVIPKKGDIILYGYDINKLIKMNFGELEKVLGVKAKVDSEVAVVFISKSEDVINKTTPTSIKDYIDFIYGPIEDLSIYERYEKVSPLTISFYGSLCINEDSTKKQSIIRELQKNLPKNYESKRIIENICRKYFLGEYSKEDSVININFKSPKFPIAKFTMGFSPTRKEIFYRYFFSLTKEPYP